MRNLSPKRMTEVIKETKVALRRNVLESNFSGHHIQVNGKINSADDIGYNYVSFYIKDQDNIHIALNFDTPPTPEVSVLGVGDNVVAQGEIRNVSDSMVVLDHCILISTSESRAREEKNRKIENSFKLPEVFEEKKIKWWEKTWVQFLFVLGAIASIIAIIFYLVEKFKK